MEPYDGSPEARRRRRHRHQRAADQCSKVEHTNPVKAEAPPQTRFHGVSPDKAEGTRTKQRSEVMQGPGTLLMVPTAR